MLSVCDYITEEMGHVREVFDNELRGKRPAEVDDSSKIASAGTGLASEMLDQVGLFGGKMIRPILVLLCGGTCGRLNHRHYTIAAVAEMVHLATLIHDDVLDEADVRRNRPTVNSLHGNERAVILGDLLFAHAFRLCDSLESRVVNQMFAEMSKTICEGELMQLGHRGNYELTEPLYLEIISRKTAGLMALCCHLGAYSSDAEEDTCQAFYQFGLNLGIAFQIMDDITDFAGDESTSGKTLGTDMAQEKITLPIIHFLQNAGESDKKWLHSQYTEGVSRLLLEKLRLAGSIEYARRLATEYIERAEKNIQTLPPSQMKQSLLELALQVIT